MSMNPYDHGDAWDTFLCDDDPAPGMCIECAGATNPRKWDEKAGNASSGSSLVYGGDGLATFTTKHRLSKRAHYDAWEAWKLHLLPPTDKDPKAKLVFHPRLQQLPRPVTAAVVIEPGSPDPQPNGVGIVEIKWKEYRKSKPAGTTANGTGGGKGSGGKAPGAKDSVDTMIDKLKGEVEKLA